MVILISGESSTGKTIMAQKLLEIYKIPYLSIDHLKMGLIRGDKNCLFTADDDNDKISGILWPIVKGIIETNIENEQSIIVEGCYMPPKNVAEICKKYSDKIIALYLVFSKNYIKNNFEEGIIAHRCDIEKRLYDEERNKYKICEENAALKQQCEKNNTKYFEIESDYDKEIKRAYEWIDSCVKTFE